MGSTSPMEECEDERVKQGAVAVFCLLWAKGDVMGRRRCPCILEMLGLDQCSTPEQFKT